MSLLVKICGLRTPEAVETALGAGADMVGFVFFPPSPRHVAYEAARALGAQVRGRALKVALSVDADDEHMAAMIEALEPDLLQLHGRETRERVIVLRDEVELVSCLSPDHHVRVSPRRGVGQVLTHWCVGRTHSS